MFIRFIYSILYLYKSKIDHINQEAGQGSLPLTCFLVERILRAAAPPGKAPLTGSALRCSE